MVAKGTIAGLRITITGQVQGVGFRPHVYRIATRMGLRGWVQNTAAGVMIEIQGPSHDDFIPQLQASLPPLAKIKTIKTRPITLCHHEPYFQIIASKPGQARSIIAPDTCICADCLNELFDPQSHYYGYPFLNCTQCGPRLSLTRKLPYDRAHTAMDAFPLCEHCYQEYSDPSNRRYHAQPTACSHCGPQLSASIDTIVTALRAGKIIAIKGLGGYQLICDARQESALLTLRQRKNREQKPFALMLVNHQSAAEIVDGVVEAQSLLMGPARPIVLLKQRDQTLPQAIAPGLSHLGVMLPSTPLHYLIFHGLAGYPQGLQWLDAVSPDILIVTSANLSGQPLIIDDESAQKELSAIADLILSYNRSIITRVDDSVVRIINNKPSFIRRARGFVPEPIKLAFSIPATLALGGHLKNTFCITRDDEAFVSQHIGSLTNKATLDFLHESLNHWLRFLDLKLEQIACDLHPDFYTTELAQEFNLPIHAVQHHHAHIAAVAAEHHILKPALGLALDGYGYGTDGSAWGGELLLLGQSHMQRLGSLLPLALPGGDSASREPWRMAAAMLHRLGRNDEILHRFPHQAQAPLLANLLKTQFRLPLTSSCGRWFDAASALLGLNLVSDYESQAAQRLESLVTELEVLPQGWCIENNQFNMLATFEHLLGLDPIKGANLFHGTLVAGLAQWLLSWAKKLSIDSILLSGGCFLNKVLSEGLYQQLSDQGLTVYFSQAVPPNDGGLSLGQAWVAGVQRRIHVSCNARANHQTA